MSRRIQSPSTVGLVTGFQHDLMILVLNKHNACEVGLCIWIVVEFSNSLILTFNKIRFWGGGLCVDVDCFADVSDILPVHIWHEDLQNSANRVLICTVMSLKTVSTFHQCESLKLSGTWH